MTQKSDFNIYFEQRFNSAKKTDFENWFAKLASRRYGSEFELIKAGGQRGDKKSDGRHISDEVIFQCYAPESSTTFALKAAKKIQDSFPEVLHYWPNTKKWFFVHNNVGGLPTGVSNKLEELRELYPEIIIRAVDRDFLKDEFHDRLTLAQLHEIYPEKPLDFANVKMQHVMPLLKKIIEERKASADLPEMFGEIPSAKKLDHNKLSKDSVRDINHARLFTNVVERYIRNLDTPGAASMIQNAMREKYSELVGFGYVADEILVKLREFVGSANTSEEINAAYVIVTYFFDTCDVFENVPEDSPC